ncbi:MAG: LytTR family DNA-binding domain-containing protein [Bacteroidota bacterium]
MILLILEDEIPAFEKLQAHLKVYFKNELHFDWARTVSEAKDHLLQDDRYDLILADIELLDGNSFDLFKEVTIRCPIIFCSAYDKYLFEAFKSNGIAYLLKPYTHEELCAAFAKYEVLFKDTVRIEIDPDMMSQFRELLHQTRKDYKDRLVIKNTKSVYLLNTVDVSLIMAKGTFCKCIDHKGKTHLLSQSIGVLVEKLNPRVFFRINRSQIVNIGFIESMEHYFKNRLSLQIKGTEKRAITSSEVTPRFRAWLESQ